MDELIARRAGNIAARTGLDFGDAAIGATAIQLDEPVLTRNVADFEKIDHVEITTY
jgi:tRNA(fMet)-specific endonuclease VapC